MGKRTQLVKFARMNAYPYADMCSAPTSTDLIFCQSIRTEQSANKTNSHFKHRCLRPLNKGQRKQRHNC